MARIVDLPSRYVEGYLVPAGGEEGTVVNGKMPTPGWRSTSRRRLGPVQPDAGSGEPSPDPEGEGGGNGGQPDASPSPQPTESPTEAPEEEPTEEPTASPSATPDPGEDQPQPEGGSDTSDEPEVTPEPDEEPETDEEARCPNRQAAELIWLVLILALIGLAAWWVLKRLRASDPENAEKRRRNRGEAGGLVSRDADGAGGAGQAPARARRPRCTRSGSRGGRRRGDAFPTCPSSCRWPATPA